jgi:hypothetical protein
VLVCVFAFGGVSDIGGVVVLSPLGASVGEAALRGLYVSPRPTSLYKLLSDNFARINLSSRSTVWQVVLIFVVQAFGIDCSPGLASTL